MNWLLAISRPLSRFKSACLGFLFTALFAGPAAAEPPHISMTHRLLSLTPTTADVAGAEYEFTITNEGDVDLFDLRFALGIGTPLPVHHDGQPTMRLPALLSGETVTTVYTVTIDAKLALFAGSGLAGWVEAIEDHGGDIVRAGISSLRSN